MSVKIAGDWSKFEKCLGRLANFNFTGMHQEIGEYIVSSTQRRFKTETSPGGEKWPKSIRAKNERGQTLSDTRRLRNSIGYRATPDGVEAGTNVKYAAVHQGREDGKPTVIKPKKAKALRFKIGDRWATKKAVRIPARPFLGINEEDEKEIGSIINDRIEETVKR